MSASGDEAIGDAKVEAKEANAAGAPEEGGETNPEDAESKGDARKEVDAKEEGAKKEENKDEDKDEKCDEKDEKSSSRSKKKKNGGGSSASGLHGAALDYAAIADGYSETSQAAAAALLSDCDGLSVEEFKSQHLQDPAMHEAIQAYLLRGVEPSSQPVAFCTVEDNVCRVLFALVKKHTAAALEHLPLLLLLLLSSSARGAQLSGVQAIFVALERQLACGLEEKKDALVFRVPSLANTSILHSAPPASSTATPSVGASVDADDDPISMVMHNAVPGSHVSSSAGASARASFLVSALRVYNAHLRDLRRDSIARLVDVCTTLAGAGTPVQAESDTFVGGPFHLPISVWRELVHALTHCVCFRPSLRATSRQSLRIMHRRAQLELNESLLLISNAALALYSSETRHQDTVA